MTAANLTIGEWQVHPRSNRLSGAEATVEVEPRVMDLLMLLASRPGDVFSKDQIIEALWNGVHVNEDALTRSVFKLRKALNDDAKQPTYIETVSKRGYRLIAAVSDNSGLPPNEERFFRRRTSVGIGIGLAVGALICGWILFQPSGDPPFQDQSELALIERADGFYSQFTRADNEAAARIYESVLADQPENASALAGLSNAIAQRIIRYEGPADDRNADRRSLTEALDSGWLDTPEAAKGINRSVELAVRATSLDPSHTRAWRALGLAKSALRDFDAAQRAYERALVIDPEDWGTMINMSELSVLNGTPENSSTYLEQAWYSMERNFSADAVAIRPWHSAVGLAVAQDRFEAGALEESKLWFQRVLKRDPLNAEGGRGLAKVFDALGEPEQAQQVCRDLGLDGELSC